MINSMCKKLIVLPIALIIIVILSSIISNCLFYIFTDNPIEITSLNPYIIVSNIITNEDIKLMFIIISIAFIVIAVASSLKLFKKENYRAKTYKVTDNIEIPLPVGKNQTQHGSAWWLPANKFSENFGVNTVDPENLTIKALLDFGNDLKKEVASKENPDVKSIISKDYGELKTVFKTGGLTVGKKNRRVFKLTSKKLGFLKVFYLKSRKVEDIYYIKDNLHSLTLGATRSRKDKVCSFRVN